MFKKLILMENKRNYQFDSSKELMEKLLGDNYYNLSRDKQIQLMKLNAMANVNGTDLKVVDLSQEKLTGLKNIEGKFIVYDEITYVLSLLLTNRVFLLESTKANIYTKYMDKSNISDNYIIVNKFADKLLSNYIQREMENMDDKQL